MCGRMNTDKNEQEPSSGEDHKLYAYNTLGRICCVCSEAVASIGPSLVFLSAVCAKCIIKYVEKSVP